LISVNLIFVVLCYNQNAQTKKELIWHFQEGIF